MGKRNLFHARKKIFPFKKSIVNFFPFKNSILNFFCPLEKFFSAEKKINYGGLNGKKFFPGPKIFLGGKKN
jgi:hypothetical protein